MKENQLILSKNDNLIEFRLQNHELFGKTDFRQDIWEEFNSVNWYVNLKSNKGKNYVYTGSNFFSGKHYLHVIVMMKWYGVEKVKEAHENGYVVEHFDNQECNCLISNLAFVSNDLNLTKAHSYDKERVKYRDRVAVNFFKDFHTQQYQVTFGFNSEVSLEYNNNLVDSIVLRLVYEDDFRQVFQDVTNAMHHIVSTQKLNLNLLSFEVYEVIPTVLIKKSSINGSSTIINKDGKWFFIISDLSKIYSVAPNPDLYKEK